jgi:tetratricopeptide (TPR) repeat protein
LLEWIQESMQNKPFQRKALTGAVIALFALMAPINLLANNYKEHDRTGNYVAFDYSYNILQSCEPNGIVFTNGDNDTFPLWYLQYVTGIRKDVRVVNLSLLNTPWYIKQLKHEEPRVPISLTDDEIDQLEIMRWEPRTIKIPVPDQVRMQFTQDLGETKRLLMDSTSAPSELTVEVKPTVFGQALRVQDYMILNILYANKWQKPIYFAVTVSDQNKVNLQKYLRMDGLAFKMVPYDGDFLSTEKLEKYLFDTFQYRNLSNPAVYYNENIVGLLQNYRAAFLRLAHEYMGRKQYDKMDHALDQMEKFMPSNLIPAPDIRLYLQIGQMYELGGRPEEFLKWAKVAVQQEPDNALALGTLISLYSRDGQHDKSVALLEDWVAKNPTDKEAARKLDEEKALLNNTSGTGFPESVVPPTGDNQPNPQK